MKNKCIIKITTLFLLFFISLATFAQPHKYDKTISLSPKNIVIEISCEKDPDNDGLGDDFHITVKDIPTTDILNRLMLENLDDIFALSNCSDIKKIISVPDSEWIQQKAPNYPLTTSLAVYNFKINAQNWLLIKDLTASSTLQPIYYAFLWKNNRWQEQPNFFGGISFYGFEKDNVITGFYESSFFIRHINRLKGTSLEIIKKEVIVDEQVIKTYKANEEIIPDEAFVRNE